MLCKALECIFIHIPKTGGQSIENFFTRTLSSKLDPRGTLLLQCYNPDPRRGPERLDHMTAQEYVSLGFIDAERFHSYYRFSFVRNPWDRLVSEFYFRRIDRRLSFRRFILEEVPMLLETDHGDRSRHVLPQFDFLHDAAGSSLVDFVGRFESLQRDFERVCEDLGLVKGLLPRLNVSVRDRGLPYASYYDPDTRELVRKVYQKDIETFGYFFA